MPDRPDRPTTSTFSKRFAAALRGYMRERDIRQSDLATSIHRSPGFVSAHLSGARPVDTDMLYAVADLAGIDARRLTDEVTRRMGDLPPEPPPPSVTTDRIVRKARTQASGGKSAKPPRRRKRGA